MIRSLRRIDGVLPAQQYPCALAQTTAARVATHAGFCTSPETENDRTLAVLPLLAASLIAVEAPRQQSLHGMACPEAVRQQLHGLYRWQVQRMDQPEPAATQFSSQRDRFTPALFNLLLQARELTPKRDGRHLDFDVFSNTQARTFGAVVTGCSAAQGNSIEAAVDVQFGLGSRASDIPRQLIYTLKCDSAGHWRIAEITYRNEREFQLTAYLESLLDPTP